ncbi:DUF1428 domain-containing protein [Salinicola lusitanus]|uniref:DUF1428 domain-containing protein n=1 Tax=Salinicola lusitanus TaxID=1949085 RepID=A0ABZ3CZ43_9GAMM
MHYVQGFVVPVDGDKRDAYHALAEKAATFFLEQGAIRIVEAWGEDVPDGKVTDFKRSVAAQADEQIVFSWIEWPDKSTCETAAQRMQSDERFKMPDDLPFDGKRTIWAGFTPFLDRYRDDSAT